MSSPKPVLAALVGGVAMFALLATDAEAARKKGVAKSQTRSDAVRSSYGYQPPRAFDIQSSGGYYRPAPGTNILHGGPAAGWGGPP
jgi:hypothetical protein